MRENYEKPMIMVEEYVLDTAIATGCQNIVNLGNTDHEYNGTYYTTCSYYKQEEMESENPESMNFFEDTCSCYISAGGETMFTS